MTAFDSPGRFWRGNLHTHTTMSDGALSPSDTVDAYRAAGYDFVSITDHYRAEYGFPLTDTRPLRSEDFTTLLGAELHAPRASSSSEWHILAVGLPSDFPPSDRGETGPLLARRARRAGAFIGMAHPSASLLTLADAQTLDAAHAVEVYNAVSAWEDRGDSWHLFDVLVARGHRLTAYAADDAHFQPQDPPGCTAWVQVRARSLEPRSLLKALKAGDYYSSTGPTLYDVSTMNGEVTVQCSPATRVLLTGGVPGKQLEAGEDLTEVTLPITMFKDSYFRVTVVDKAGGRAWSNPIWLR
ncbi:CehA/McbA family metallohydrolase [Actinophytocola oryzae]|uniref:Polymerase/histidinol phosphatase N-terminal domain-containing protein n=1 Tax=Actinophytocola oryzae TaxID=502181 RepID=A0A4V3FTQ1_9PSEU|nr:CehA/McbA family metallohydrolase [Actinophytocola oryzae]TDV52161.1 hypothetical protein CLV71_105292 [Actinophytocola oryzae]